MDEKTLAILEYPKILERLAAHCDFPASAEKARRLRPLSDLFLARQKQAETAEALRLLNLHPGFDIGGARDVRAQVDLALHGGVLTPSELLDVQFTLAAGRDLNRAFERMKVEYPLLADILAQLPPPLGLIDLISHAISEHAEILDSASEKLAQVRRELRVVHDRLMTRLQKMVGDPHNTPYLQDALVTQRDGRYVIPLRSEFKGRIRSIVHDQSASGATLFVEPIGVVELNNQYRELQLAERDEERRILAQLSYQVGLHAEAINHLVDVVAVFDLALARARYADEILASQPILHEICKRELHRASKPREDDSANRAGEKTITHPGSLVRLYRARHPLLDPATVVPIDVELDEQTFIMVVTGPNTGGKTVALKTVGLLVLMAQSGLHIPAGSGSELSVFDSIFADVGDEQSIEQSLSTFSGHITNIIHILEQADNRSLVILDELGAGTDPQEGSALARAILDSLTDRSITTLVTTHHPELKAYAHATPGVTNASVEFDLQTLRPTFRLTVGLPGRSNALAIAERLGLPGEIIAEARTEIHPDELQADSLLDEIYSQRELAQRARETAEQDRLEAEELREQLAGRLEKIEDERVEILDDARQEAAGRLEELQNEMSELRKELAKLRTSPAEIKPLQEQVDALLDDLQQAEERIETVSTLPVRKTGRAGGPKISRREIQPGDRVRLRKLGALGVVTTLNEGEAEVQMGVMRVRARLSDLELTTPSGATAESGASSSALKASQTVYLAQAAGVPKKISLPDSPGIELDLRGKRADEALDDLERYLDSAFISGLPFVRIIHGKGSGRLRDIVRKALVNSPQVKSFEGGGEKEGGEGVTVARLAVS